eukprot:Gb_28599 [translate_table: standard]
MAEPTSLRFHLLAGIGLLGFILSTLPVLGVELIPLDAAHSIENINGICGTFVWPRGYDCSEFMVPTDDGFLLSMQRISSGKFQTMSGKEPVFLYHGLMQGGETWVLNEPYESLGFMLADSGYDIWIGSTRSSTFSYGHKTYKRSDEEFWDWNWDDLVAHDLPAMLHFVNDMTMKPILYVGFSQGSMTGFAGFTNNNISKLVKKAAMLCPIAYLGHIASPVSRAAASLFLDQFELFRGIHEFNLSMQGNNQLLDIMCMDRNAKSNCNDSLLTLVTGPTCCVNESRVAYYKKYDSQSTSTRNMVQLAQLTRSGRFCKYDYGLLENLEQYWDFFPPSYDLSKVPKNLPFFFAYGGKDLLADEMDVKRLADELPGEVVKLFMPNYSHMDFVLGTSAHIDVYPAILHFFKQY